jgi:hypothetical protein
MSIAPLLSVDGSNVATQRSIGVPISSPQSPAGLHEGRPGFGKLR